MRSRPFAWIALAGLWLPSPARALTAAESVQLRYTAPANCPDRESLLRAIDGFVDPDARLDSTLDVDARIDARDDGEYSLNLRWTSDSGAGQRNMDAESCQAAADAAAWLIALAIKRPDVEKHEAQPSETGGRKLHYEFGFDVTSAFGVLPGIGWAGHLRGGIGWHALQAGIVAGYFPAKSVGHAGASIDVSLIELGAEACYLVNGTGFALGPCAFAALGQMAASSRDLRAPNAGDSRFQMLAFGVQARIHVASSLWLLGDAALAWHQRRPLFVLTGAGSVHQARSLGARVGLGVVWLL
jgi:hypothetical protein